MISRFLAIFTAALLLPVVAAFAGDSEAAAFFLKAYQDEYMFNDQSEGMSDA